MVAGVVMCWARRRKWKFSDCGFEISFSIPPDFRAVEPCATGKKIRVRETEGSPSVKRKLERGADV